MSENFPNVVNDFDSVSKSQKCFNNIKYTN